MQLFTWTFTMKDSNAWHNTLLEMQAFIAQQENTTVISCHCLFLPQKASKMEWNQKKGEIGIPMLIKVDIMCNEYSNWMFALNVWIECLHRMFDMHIYIECRNWMFESNDECPTCKCDLHIWILKGKVSIKDVKFKSNTRLFEDNIQMLHEWFEDYH